MFLTDLTLTGFGSYRDECHLALRSVHACVVVGENGAGKSTLFEAVLWALFGETPDRSADSVIHADSDEANVKVQFLDADGTQWTVRRGRKRSGHQVVRAESDDGRGATKVKEVATLMADVLGVDAAVLCATAFARQGAAGLFATEGGAKRREILQRGISHLSFSEMLKAASDKESAAKERVTISENEVERTRGIAEQLETRMERLAECTRRAATAERQVRALEELLADTGPVGSALASLREARQAVKDLETARAALAKAKRGKQAAATRQVKGNERIEELRAKQEVAEKAAEKADQNSRKAAELAAAAKSSAQQAPERLKMLQKNEGSECWVCDAPLTAAKRGSLIDAQQKLIDAAQGKSGSAERLESASRRARRAVSQASNDVSAARVETEQEQSVIDRCNLAAEKATTNIKHYAPKAALVDDLEAAADDEINRSDIAEKMRSARDEERKAHEAVGSAKRATKEAERCAERLPVLIEDAKASEVELAHSRWLTKAMRPTGVPQVAMQRVADTVSRAANRTLAAMGGMQVRFVATEEGSSQSMVIYARTIEEDWRSYSTFSGGERMRMDIAFRVALCHVIGVRSGMMVLDEGWGVLDREGAHQLGGVLHQLIAENVVEQVFTITHVPAAADVFPQRIEVTKEDGSSRAELVAA